MLILPAFNNKRSTGTCNWLGLSLILIGLIFVTSLTVVAGNEEEEGEHEELEIEPPNYILFPFFVEAIGALVFYLTTYHLGKSCPLPYTAIMFIFGMIMGIVVNNSTSENALRQSIVGWANIDSELLFVSFLPGLLFWDSISMNKYMFYKGFPQILTLAFPMVLAGTCLTALVFLYIFPYDWSFNLCMTVGAILSATDPVAVSALLAEVGAPPRMQTLISGESLFNDGSAMVFFTIFSKLFFFELGIEGFGEQIDVAQGFATFFRMSLGGMALGIGFGFVLTCLLYVLNRRLSSETNKVEVCTILTIAYLSFYTSEITCSPCSGVLAVVSCGIFTSTFGDGYLNDPHLLESFWEVLEQLLNTLLFCLGGVVWGRVIADPNVDDSFGGKDWGYLILLFVFLLIIRFFLIAAFYPILVRTGLSTNWQESVFSAYGGLRGAVGISLAIAIDNDVRSETDDPSILALTNKVFGFVGGIAFLTLIINGSTAGWVLVKLGLAKSTATRERVLKQFEKSLAATLLSEYADMLLRPEFRNATLEMVVHYMPIFGSLFTEEDVKRALKDKKKKLHAPSDLDETAKTEDTQPLLNEYPSDGVFDGTKAAGITDSEHSEEEGHAKAGATGKMGGLDLGDISTEDKEKEIRLIFLELLNAGYEKQKRHGYLDSREDDGFVLLCLSMSIDMARDNINRGGKLNDWECATSFEKRVNRVDELISCSRETSNTWDYQTNRIFWHRSICFVYAHTWARERLETEFIRGSKDLKEAAKTVSDESLAEEKLARDVLDQIDPADKSKIEANYVCTVLLNRLADHISEATHDGLLSEKEGQGYLDEIDTEINKVHISAYEVKAHDLSSAKKKILDALNSKEEIEEVPKADQGEITTALPKGEDSTEEEA